MDHCTHLASNKHIVFFVKAGHTENTKQIKIMTFDYLSPKEYEGENALIFNGVGLKMPMEIFSFSSHANDP